VNVEQTSSVINHSFYDEPRSPLELMMW